MPQLVQGYDPVIGTDEDPRLRLMVISESKTRLAVRKLHVRLQTGTKRIRFREDTDGVTMPSNLPYPLTKANWKGKLVVKLKHIQYKARKKKKLKMASNCAV
ncbi:hypothetical protein A4A49_53719 [Nicotiana attenuata]|uniref:Uncharacterized protein n=1 Tax=Nicotiana attenuata TaxID=49451 RepID=A0A1J6IDN0_NICAT|nr:hypothetical protein A4A49_53719 [Nicotiana attenuata]